MIRTQISLDKDEYLLVKKGARALGISVAEFVRRAVRQTLPPAGKGAWMRYTGFVESGDSHSSQCIDDLIYGTKDRLYARGGSARVGRRIGASV